jgi:eukaryotic-like serine/threonine-protein kinase
MRCTPAGEAARFALVHSGDRLGPYVLRREIGEGGIAAVFVAQHAEKKTDAIVKVFREDLLFDAEALAIFLAEPRALQAVEHENTLEVTEVVAEGRHPYFATELLRGRTLAELLRRGPVPLPRAVHIARQVAAVLAHAHDVEVVHRNIKPANVFLVEKDGERDVVKLLELGATRMQSQGVKPVPGTVIGTPAYMAPEQLRQTAGDHRVDMYSFGVLLFELAVGRRPFVGELTEVVRQHLLEPPPRASALAPAVPAVLDKLIERCLEKDPAARPPSMHEVSLDLAALAEALGPPAPADDGPPPSIAVPKNTSGYTIVAADVTAAPPATFHADDDEPSFPTITDEREAVPGPVPAPTPPRAAPSPSPLRRHGPLLAAAGGLAALGLIVLVARGGEDEAPVPTAPPAAAPELAAPAEPPEPAPQLAPAEAGGPAQPARGAGPGKKEPAGSHLVGFGSTPRGAQVWIRMDRRIRFLCNAPCEFALPAGKEVLVELRLDGYVSAQRTLTVVEGARFDGTLRRR